MGPSGPVVCSGQASIPVRHQRQLYQHDWVVYAKTPLGGPAQVLEYLSRYTHRTAIGLSASAPSALTRWCSRCVPRHKAANAGSAWRAQSSSCVAQRIEAHPPQPHAQAMESAQGFMARVANIDVGLCPCCKLGRLQVCAVLQAPARLPSPAHAAARHNRGPS